MHLSPLCAEVYCLQAFLENSHFADKCELASCISAYKEQLFDGLGVSSLNFYEMRASEGTKT